MTKTPLSLGVAHESGVTLPCRSGCSVVGRLVKRWTRILACSCCPARWRLHATASLLLSLCGTSLAADPAWLTGVRAAHACEAQIDSELWTYAGCIDHAAAQRGRPAADLAALYFQAWLMADLAWTQDADGAAVLRERWWRSWQRHSRRSGLTMDRICQARGLACDDIRLRQARGQNNVKRADRPDSVQPVPANKPVP
jgi:hypothetical protein